MVRKLVLILQGQVVRTGRGVRGQGVIIEAPVHLIVCVIACIEAITTVGSLGTEHVHIHHVLPIVHAEFEFVRTT